MSKVTCFSFLCSFLSDLVRQYICHLMLSQWNAESKSLEWSIAIITTILGVVVVAAAGVIIDFLIFFSLWFTGCKHEHSSILFYTQLKIVHLVESYLCIAIEFVCSMMRLTIQCPSVYTVQKTEADKWHSRYFRGQLDFDALSLFFFVFFFLTSMVNNFIVFLSSTDLCQNAL